MQLGLGIEELPLLLVILPEAGAMFDLHAVGIPDHVIHQHDTPHARQLHTPRLKRMPPAHLEPLAPLGNLLHYPRISMVVKPPVLPVPMRT